MAVPPITSSRAPMPISEPSKIGGIGTGLGGYPNSFIVPKETNIAPATMRRMLSILPVQGERDGSKIDMTAPCGQRPPKIADFEAPCPHRPRRPPSSRTHERSPGRTRPDGDVARLPHRVCRDRHRD